jgi:hypothetical protein
MQSDAAPTMAAAAGTYAHAVRRSTSSSRSVSTVAGSSLSQAASSSSAGSSEIGSGAQASASSTSASATDSAHSDAHDGRPRLADFELLRVLGQGSYGKVMLARHAHSQQLFAMKILRKDTVLKREQVANTRRCVWNSRTHYGMFLPVAFV